MGTEIWCVPPAQSMIVHPISTCLVTGDLVYLRIFGQGILFLNSVEATIEILEKRGAMYADRPRTVMLSELYVYRPYQVCSLF